MSRHYFSAEDLSGDSITLNGHYVHHLQNVLRIKPGYRAILCCGDRIDYTCVFDSFEPLQKANKAHFKIICSSPNVTEPQFKVTLYQSILKHDKLELVIQKAVELGVYEIFPTITERCIPRPNKLNNKIERMQKISESAAMQSGRGLIPVVHQPIPFDSALVTKPSNSLWLLANEAAATSLKQINKPSTSTQVGLWIGPEGSFSAAEIEKLESVGAVSFSMGARILRAETAAIVGLSQIYCLWEM